MNKLQAKMGTVVTVENDRLYVEIQPTVGKRCGPSCTCKPFSSEESPNGPRIYVPISNPKQFLTGDTIRLEGNLPSIYLGYFLVLGLPIFGLLAGAFIGHDMAVSYGIKSREMMTAAIAAVGFFALLMPAAIFDYFKRRNQQVFRVVDNQEYVVQQCTK